MTIESPNLSETQMNEVQEITELLNHARELFTRMLNDSISTDQTTGSCFYACYLSKLLIDKFSPFEAIYRGGDGHGDGGYKDSKGNIHGHYWLEVVSKRYRYIVDITADQFGDLPVVVLPIDSASQYISGNQQIIDEHYDEYKQHV